MYMHTTLYLFMVAIIHLLKFHYSYWLGVYYLTFKNSFYTECSFVVIIMYNKSCSSAEYETSQSHAGICYSLGSRPN